MLVILKFVYSIGLCRTFFFFSPKDRMATYFTYLLHVSYLDSRSVHSPQSADESVSEFPVRSQIFQWLGHPVGGL